MRTNSNISRKVMLSAFGLPMLGVYMLTIWCGLGNFLAECCDHHNQPSVAHHADSPGHSDDHHHDPHSHGHSHDHSGDHHQKNSEDDDGCCSDVTTAFFLVFQQKAQPYTVDFHPSESPAAILRVAISQYFPKLEGHALQKWMPPPRPAPSGFSLRILHQSYLI